MENPHISYSMCCENLENQFSFFLFDLLTYFFLMTYCYQSPRPENSEVSNKSSLVTCFPNQTELVLLKSRKGTLICIAILKRQRGPSFPALSLGILTWASRWYRRGDQECAESGSLGQTLVWLLTIWGGSGRSLSVVIRKLLLVGGTFNSSQGVCWSNLLSPRWLTQGNGGRDASIFFFNPAFRYTLDICGSK